ncbi:hypothetical protein GDO81_020553 [Engystomops pustulosus]|uniref:Uncharacterized protein n=1 Tax=Engystomops pustulosus TaxID=76066 RepID=A0AAV6Z7Y4_ENGPU|nr:hypothetical protein GDO81_020553 [Engystomops pustulosus]
MPNFAFQFHSSLLMSNKDGLRWNPIANSNEDVIANSNKDGLQLFMDYLVCKAIPELRRFIFVMEMDFEYGALPLALRKPRPPSSSVPKFASLILQTSESRFGILRISQYILELEGHCTNQCCQKMFQEKLLRWMNEGLGSAGSCIQCARVPEI